VALVIGWVTPGSSSAPMRRSRGSLISPRYLVGTPLHSLRHRLALVFGKAGPVNHLYRTLTGSTDVLINIYSMPGMVLVEGFLWSPLAFLWSGRPCAMPTGAGEARACMVPASGTPSDASLALSLPSILGALDAVFIRAIEAFEVPALGSPAGPRLGAHSPTSIPMVARAPPDIGGASALSC